VTIAYTPMMINGQYKLFMVWQFYPDYIEIHIHKNKKHLHQSNIWKLVYTMLKFCLSLDFDIRFFRKELHSYKPDKVWKMGVENHIG
jgi:hypothetical protein